MAVLPARGGVSLLEVVVAAGVLATVLTGVVPLVTTAVQASARSRVQVLAARLAASRLSELESLAHARTSIALISDQVSRLDTPAMAMGGPGLLPAGLSTLDEPPAGWSDQLDAEGRYLAGGAGPVPGARFSRRWAVASAGDGCLSIWVDVRDLHSHVIPAAATAAGLRCPWGVPEP